MALPFFPEEHIRNIYLSFEMLLSGLLYAERELIHRFNNYFHKFWINGSANLSVFTMKSQRTMDQSRITKQWDIRL